jgi:hemoglobin-like flavoprotein
MSTTTKQLMNSLSPAQRKQVETIVRRFAHAHPDAGILPQELEQVYGEVIEAVQFQSFFPENSTPAIKSWEQAQHYTQFIAPSFGY